MLGFPVHPRQANFFGILRIARAVDTAVPTEISQLQTRRVGEC
jgi:hypothetical protein